MLVSGSSSRIVEVLEVTERDGEPMIIALDYSAASKLRIPFSEFVAGISRLKVVRAHAVMQPLDDYQKTSGSVSADAPRVNEAEALSALINLAIGTSEDILVEKDGKDIGVITRADILRTVIEGTEVS